MRTIILVLAAALTGCATMHRAPDGEVTVSYAGPSARAAATLVGATDERPLDLAQMAMDKGMATSLHRWSDGSAGFSAGYGYAGGYGWGGNVQYAAPDMVSTPGGWYARTGGGGILPVLSRTVAIAQETTRGGIVPCPKSQDPNTVAQQAACADQATRLLMRNRKKGESR